MNYKEVLLYLILLPGILFAGGIEKKGSVGAKTFALDGMYLAGTDGMSSIFSNPAGLSFISGLGIELSIIDKVESNEFDSPDYGLFKSYSHDNFGTGGGFYWGIAEDAVVGAAYHQDYNYKVDWPFVLNRSTDTSSSILAFNMTSEIDVNSISPSVAFRFQSFSIGLTANIYRISENISFPVNNKFWGTSGSAAYQFKYNVDGWAFGGTLGIIYILNDNMRVGVTARSGYKSELKGEAESPLFSVIDSTSSKADVKSDFEIPWKFGLGFLYKLSESISINLDGSYNLWGTVPNYLTYTFDNSIWQNRTSEIDSISGVVPGSIPLFFRNSFELGAGVEFSTTSLKYWAGYSYSQTPNTEASYSFFFPGTDQHTISFGIELKQENLSINAGLAYTFSPSKTVTSSANPFLPGEYSSNGYIPSITLRYEIN